MGRRNEDGKKPFLNLGKILFKTNISSPNHIMAGRLNR
jgi:hypothetical protein